MCVYVCVGVCSFTSLLSLASNFCVISSDLEFMATKELTARTCGSALGRMAQTEQETA